MENGVNTAEITFAVLIKVFICYNMLFHNLILFTI